MNKISDAELEIMHIVWQQHPISANDIIAQLEHEDWQPKTVKSLINRLLKKQILSFEKQGRNYLYSPVVAQEEYQKSSSQSFVARMFNGKLSNLVAAFADSDSVSPEEIKQLKKIVEELDK